VRIIVILEIWIGEVEDAQMMIDGRDQLDGYDLVANFQLTVLVEMCVCDGKNIYLTLWFTTFKNLW
jgi:hypothetical protein